MRGCQAATASSSGHSPEVPSTFQGVPRSARRDTAMTGSYLDPRRHCGPPPRSLRRDPRRGTRPRPLHPVGASRTGRHGDLIAPSPLPPTTLPARPIWSGSQDPTDSSAGVKRCWPSACEGAPAVRLGMREGSDDRRATLARSVGAREADLVSPRGLGRAAVAESGTHVLGAVLLPASGLASGLWSGAVTHEDSPGSPAAAAGALRRRGRRVQPRGSSCRRPGRWPG